MFNQGLATPSQIRTLVVTGMTGLNLLLGLTALIAVTFGEVSFGAWGLLGCVLLDAADGMLARRWGVSSAFGAQLDSLADMTSFIIASSVLLVYWFSPRVPLPWIGAAACLYVLTGAIRLARFNATLPVEGEFEGMPTTSVSAIVAMTYLTCPQLDDQWALGLVALLSLLMVSVFPYPKVCRILRYPWWFWAALGLGLLVDLSWTLWLSALAYVASGPFVWLRERLNGGSARSA